MTEQQPPALPPAPAEHRSAAAPDVARAAVRAPLVRLEPLALDAVAGAKCDIDDPDCVPPTAPAPRS